MNKIMKLVAIFAIFLVSFPVIAFAETENAEMPQQIRERVLSEEKRASVLERIMAKINSAILTQTQVQNQIFDEIKPLHVKSVQKNEIQTSANVRVIPASDEITLKIQNGLAYAVKENISKEIKAEPSVLIAKKIPREEINVATNFRVRADIQNNDLEYNVIYDIPNPVPIINWIFPVISKEVKVTSEEIKQADAQIEETEITNASASAATATPAPVRRS